MDDLLDHPRLLEWMAEAGISRGLVREAATHVLDALREAIAAQELSEEALQELLGDPTAAVVRAAEALVEPHLRRVVNGTGVVVHTNLGRSPWPASAARRVAELATAYTNLEFDLDGGSRGGRERPVSRFLDRLLPGAAVAVVNNNAAAVLLVLNTFAQGREVIVSRGELVEIGGSFRIPEVMEKGFCKLREVGTTNRTRVGDYRAAINQDTGLLLAVHPRNYRVVGFTESTPLEQLVALGEEHGVTVAEDLGSGNLVGTRVAGLDEPTVAERLATGVDLVTFSGDKLLGGPQAGFIVGKREAVERCRANPLYRAMRLDKTTLLGLEATLIDYVAGRYEAIPALRMLGRAEADLRVDAERLADLLHGAVPEWHLEILQLESRVGGGSAPEVSLPSWGVAVAAPGIGADELARRLRRTTPPVVGRIVDDRLVFDARTLLDGDPERVASALAQAAI
jgi:L-seryl-tRNA(Ser) seleniumtransferase